MPFLALYLITFTFYVTASVCTITSIFLPNWLLYDASSKVHIHITYGLTKHCSSITGICDTFPSERDCLSSPSLCRQWKSASFLMVLAAVIEGMTLVAFIAIFNGGYARRQTGWKILSLLLFLIGCAQLPATLLILHALRQADIFVLPGWTVGAGWVLATASYSLVYLGAIVVGVLGKFSPDEYSLIPNLDWNT